MNILLLNNTRMRWADGFSFANSNGFLNLINAVVKVPDIMFQSPDKNGTENI